MQNTKPLQRSRPLKTPDQLTSEQVGFVFAEKHLHLDCWSAVRLDDTEVVEDALRTVAKALHPELQHIHSQNSAQDNRITSVAITPVSQINIRTWPDMDYAAIDIFMGADTATIDVLSILKAAFLTDNIRESEHLRGRQFADLTPAKSNA